MSIMLQRVGSSKNKLFYYRAGQSRRESRTATTETEGRLDHRVDYLESWVNSLNYSLNGLALIRCLDWVLKMTSFCRMTLSCAGIETLNWNQRYNLHLAPVIAQA